MLKSCSTNDDLFSDAILWGLSKPVVKQAIAIARIEKILQDQGSRRYKRSTDISSTYCHATDQPDGSHIFNECSLWAFRALFATFHRSITI